MSLLSDLHSRLVLNRRLRILARHAISLLPESGSVLDVGCGNGVISRLIMDERPQMSIRGIDVLERPICAIPMERYDGDTLPFDDNSLDVVMFVDVLHHTNNAFSLLQEAVRVAKQAVVLKDHLCNSAFDERILSFMDWIGNRSHGVALPYNYWSAEQWRDAWLRLGCEPDVFTTRLGLYPWFARPVFERDLHFFARMPLGVDK
jgi:ubiquinone/menaquinone biosynthesis C-methylase UbiE